MNSKIRLSVIVPMFNSGYYIERCAHSLLSQTLKEGIELIFVDDQSQDDTLLRLNNVLKEYPEREESVKIIENPIHLGVFETRRRGLEVAAGEYVGWCDSDDWCEDAMYEEMLQATNVERVDIVACDYLSHLDTETKVVTFPDYTNPHNAIICSHEKNGLLTNIWNHIFRREIILKSWNMIVPTNYGEDTFAILYSYYWATSCRVVHKALYHSDRTNKKSWTKTIDKDWAQWQKIAENWNRVRALYYSQPHGKQMFHVGLNYRILRHKYAFISVFPSAKAFFNTFRDASWDYLYFKNVSVSGRLKLFLLNNIYRLCARKVFHCSKG